jgi:magnesium transporter
VLLAVFVIVDCALYDGGRRVPVGPDHAAALTEARRLGPGAFVWIGLHEPSMSEFDDLADQFGLHPLAVEDAVHAHQRPKLERYDDSLFLVLKTAVYVDHEEIIDLGELMVFAGDSFVVTVRHGEHGALAHVRKRLEDDPERLARGPMAVVHALLDEVVDEYGRVLADLDVDIDQIEEQVFSGDRRDHGQRIFKLKREVLTFKRAVRPLGPAVDDLFRSSEESLRDWFRDVHDHVLRAADHLDSVDDLLDGALQANHTQVGVQQNEDMRKISAWVAIAAVPTMIAGVYGMNFDHMPELGTRYGYFVVVAVMVAACYALFRTFKSRGWL